MNEKPNRILETQRDDRSLVELAAQRHLYNRARIWFRVEFVIDAVLTAALILLAALVESAAPWAAFGGIVTPLIATHFLRKERSELQRKAALIQEQFDCRVLEIEESAALSGSSTAMEDVVEASENLGRKHRRDLEEPWYTSSISTAPLPVARLLCQRENITWDRPLKMLAGTAFIAIACVSAGAAVVIGMGLDLSFRRFLTCLAAPMFPISYSVLRIGLDLRAAAGRLDDLRKTLERAWEFVIANPGESDCHQTHARQVQDRILANRSSAAMVPNFLYRLRRSKQEIIAGKTVDQLLEDARSARTAQNDAESED